MPRDLRLTLPTIASVATYPPGATYGPRVLRDYEFVWIIEGDATYRYGATTLAAPAGAVILCRAGETDFFQFDPHHRTRHGYCHFNISACPTDWPAPANWPVVRPPTADDILRPLFRHLLTWTGKGSALHGELTLAHLLTAFVTGEVAVGDVPREVLPDAVTRAQEYIHARLERAPAAELTLSDLARAAGVNREHLCRLFKAATNCSPMATVRLARLDRAAVLLARSNYSIDEIAAMHGFSSPFHFSRRFKEAFGRSPRDLRKALEAGETPPTSRLLQSSRTTS